MIFLILRWGIKKRLVLVHDFSSSPPCSQRCNRHVIVTTVGGWRHDIVWSKATCQSRSLKLHFVVVRWHFYTSCVRGVGSYHPTRETFCGFTSPMKNGWVGNRSGFLSGMEAKFSGASCWICRACVEFRYMFKKSQILCSAIDFQWCTKSKKL